MKTIKYIFFILIITISACLENTVPYPIVFGEFLSFDIEGKTQAAVIDAENQTITLDIEDDIDISKIKVKEYTITENASVSPKINEIEDFSNTRKFTITTYQDYEWSIDVRYANAFVKNVVIDGQTDEPAVINNSTRTITLTVKNTVDLTNVSLLEFEVSKGVTVSPDPKEVTDFSKPVQTTLTSQTGNESVWTIEVKYEKAAINKMTVKGQIGETLINTSTQSVTIFVDENNTDLSSVSVLEFEATEGVTVSPNPLEITNFTEPILVTLTSKDGKESIWTVGVQYEKAFVEHIKISDQRGNAFIDLIRQHVTIYVDKAANLAELSVLELRLSEGATSSININEITDFSKIIETTLTSGSGKESAWTIEVKYDYAVLEYEISGQVSSNINYTENKITVIVPKETDLTNLSVSKTVLQGGATASPDISTFTNFSTPQKSHITTVTGTIEEWTIEVKYDYAVLAFEIENQVSSTINYENNFIDVFIPQGTNMSNLRVIKAVLKEGATSSPDITSITDLSQPQIISITSASGTTEEWTIRGMEATQILFANMDTWWDNEFANNKFYKLPGTDENTIWSSSDVGASFTLSTQSKTIHIGSEGDRTYAHLESKKVTLAFAAGSLFVGEMTNGGFANPLTNFGIPFTSRPKSFKFDYRANAIKDDKADMYILLQVREGDKRYRLGTAWLRSGTVEDWTTETIDVHYGELPEGSPEYMLPKVGDKYSPEEGFWTGNPNVQPTHIIIVFASSFDGNNLNGEVGNSLDIDNVELVY